MRFDDAFAVFGGILIVTTIGLLLLPWRWHRRFAQRVVPPMTQHVALVGLMSLALGGAILVCMAIGTRCAAVRATTECRRSGLVTPVNLADMPP